MKKRARGLIIKDDKIILIKRNKNNFIYWCFPGGVVEERETNEEALRRECLEELGVEVDVKELFHQMPSNLPGQTEYFYLCDITGGKLGTGKGPEWQSNSGYVGTYEPQWVKIKDVEKMEVLPKEVKNLVLKYNK